MNNFERRFATGPFGNYGKGNYVAHVPALEYQTYKNFGGGFEVRDSVAQLPENASPENLDMEVDHKDRLVRMPGVDTVEIFDVRLPKQMFVQSSLDTAAELVFVDPPYVGVKASGDTVWTNVGLLIKDEVFAATNHGDVLLFGNPLNGVYARRAFSLVTTKIADAPPAAAISSFAARVLVGNIIVDGNNEPLAIGWSAADSDPENWTGIGAGFEFLIGPTVPDRIVALHPIGFDQIAILCRRSLWIGTRTGLVDRPVDFQLREDGRGAVGMRSCANVPGGVAFLSDLGVFLFNGNESQLISEQINAELLPLDLDEAEDNTLYYDPATEKLHLMMEDHCWVYDFHHQRWYKRSLVGWQMVAFPEQVGIRTWAQLTETWDQFDSTNTTWNDLRQKSIEPYNVYVLGDEGGKRVLGLQTDAEMAYFGVAMQPSWRFPSLEGVPLTQVATSKQLMVAYEGAGSVAFDTVGNDWDLGLATSAVLPSVAGDPQVYDLPFTKSGVSLGLQMRILSGSPKVSAVSVGFSRRGPRLRPRRV